MKSKFSSIVNLYEKKVDIARMELERANKELKDKEEELSNLENSGDDIKMPTSGNVGMIQYTKLLKDLRETESLIGLSGLRGSGDTVLLLQLAARLPRSFYISCDTLDPSVDLLDLVLYLQHNYKIKHFFLDEIHFYKNC